MSAVPGDLSTDVQPPLAIPLRHFLVGLGFLATGSVVALVLSSGSAGFERVAAAHLLLVGWIGVTILGAVTQFVPVWSGVPLHSDRLGSLQLVFVAVGVPGFAIGLWVGQLTAAIPFALSMVVGVLVFVYNVGRTLLAARPWDVTESHFALALGFFTAAMVIAVALVVDFEYGVFPIWSVGRSAGVAAHVTLAVFGGVLVTVAGALYQLGPMFTQSEPGAFDDQIRQFESLAMPTGVATLAVGRLFRQAVLSTVGGLLLAAATFSIGWVLWRRVRDATVPPSPMLRRYTVVAGALLAWATTAGIAWSRAAFGYGDPIGASGLRFGAPVVGPVLLSAAIGFVVLGTLYHVVPFLIWVHRYSDKVGLEAVPTIADLYVDRLAGLDLAATVGGASVVALSTVAGFLPESIAINGQVLTAGNGVIPGGLRTIGVALVVVGVGLFVVNMARTVVVHAPEATGLPGWVLKRR